jgi:hypothetical protein
MAVGPLYLSPDVLADRVVPGWKSLGWPMYLSSMVGSLVDNEAVRLTQ